jgi:hypothetical protein
MHQQKSDHLIKKKTKIRSFATTSARANSKTMTNHLSESFKSNHIIFGGMDGNILLEHQVVLHIQLLM